MVIYSLKDRTIGGSPLSLWSFNDRFTYIDAESDSQQDHKASKRCGKYAFRANRKWGKTDHFRSFSHQDAIIIDNRQLTCEANANESIKVDSISLML